MQNKGCRAIIRQDSVSRPRRIIVCSKVSVRLIRRLYSNWNAGVGLYNLKAPSLKGNEIPWTYWATGLQNCWTLARVYREVNEPKSTSQDDIGDLKSFEWTPTASGAAPMYRGTPGR